MDDRKYVIFLSSTITDLQEHRQKVINAVIRLKQIPSYMELFPSAPYALEYIEEQVKQCDVFLLLLGQSIGSPTGDGATFIQREYDFAVKHGKDILVLSIPETMFREPPLKEFARRVMAPGSPNSPIVSIFESPPEAENAAYHSLSVLIAKKNASGKGGWVDASPYDKIAGPFFDRYLEFFSSLEKFNQRTKREEAEKTLVGRVLWTILVPRLDSDPSVEAIFFESGSSTAYAAYEFLEYARKNSGYWQKSGMAENLRIVTNNFFTLLDFTLYGHGSRPVKEITLYPQGPFSEDYAATYGDIRDVRPDNRRAFHRKGWSLDSGAAEACAKVTKDIDSLLGKKGLIVMAVSGVDWSDDHICGPHVGRYRNMLMKRSLLQSTHPKVIVLDNAKWFKSFDYDECYPVCGSGIDWSTLLKDSPIAFAVGVNNADRDGKAYDIILEDLKRRGFDSVETEIAADGKVSAIIAWNSAFESWLEG